MKKKLPIGIKSVILSVIEFFENVSVITDHVYNVYNGYRDVD